MSKTLSKSKNKKIVGGNKFNFEEPSFDNNKISIKANEINGSKTVTLIFYEKKKNTQLNIFEDDIKDNINLKIITSNMTDAKYYEPNINVDNSKLNKKNIVKDMNNFDTCIIVEFNNICYIFLYVHTSGNNAIKNFNDNSNTNNLKVLNALMIANFKESGLNINFLNKFVAVVNGFVDGKRPRTDVSDNSSGSLSRTSSSSSMLGFGERSVEGWRVEEGRGGGQGFKAQSKGWSRKKINNYKILNNLILILSKINKVKNLTKTKATKPTKPNTTKPKATKPTKPKATKPTKSKATKPTKPKATKSKTTKPKPTKPKATKLKAVKPKPTKPKVTKPKATKKI